MNYNVLENIMEYNHGPLAFVCADCDQSFDGYDKLKDHVFDKDHMYASKRFYHSSGQLRFAGLKFRKESFRGMQNAEDLQLVGPKKFFKLCCPCKDTYLEWKEWDQKRRQDKKEKKEEKQLVRPWLLSSIPWKDLKQIRQIILEEKIECVENLFVRQDLILQMKESSDLNIEKVLMCCAKMIHALPFERQFGMCFSWMSDRRKLIENLKQSLPLTISLIEYTEISLPKIQSHIKMQNSVESFLMKIENSVFEI